MAKRIRSANKKTKQIDRLGLPHQLRQPIVYVPVLIIFGTLLYFGLLQYRAIREREAFRQLERKTASAIGGITLQAAAPLYTDIARSCSMQAPEEFSSKKLYCDMQSIIYYEVSPDNKDNVTLAAKEALEKYFGTQLKRSGLIKSAGVIDYSVDTHPMARLSIDGVTCGIGVRYPVTYSGGAELPRRTFSTNDNIMSVHISCDKQVVKPIYPMVNR